MSKHGKDNDNFEFIKEQVIEKKRKKIRKRLFPLLMTIVLAILFGMIAAVTFVVAEPRLYKLLHKEEDNKTSVTFPTKYQEENSQGVPSTGNNSNTEESESVREPDMVILEQYIDADIKDYVSMYDDIKKVAHEINKSLVDVSSTISSKDWFGATVERTINTTGVVIANDNGELLILISLDRVKDASSIKVQFSATDTVNAVLYDYETELNLAVIAVSIEDIPQIYRNSIKRATLGESYTITIGSPVIALGSPNGHPDSMGIGIISNCNNYVYITDNKLDLFNTNLENNENSDGIIVNLDGEVVGVITRTLKDEISEDLSTALGISKIKPTIERMANKQPRNYVGVNAEDITEAAKKEHEISNGIYVNEVEKNSPAFNAGITSGDIILEVNEKKILSTNNFNNTIANYQPGEEVTIKIKRTIGSAEKELELPVVIQKKEQ